MPNNNCNNYNNSSTHTNLQKNEKKTCRISELQNFVLWQSIKLRQSLPHSMCFVMPTAHYKKQLQQQQQPRQL